MFAPGVAVFNVTLTELADVPPLGLITGVATIHLLEPNVLVALVTDSVPESVVVDSVDFGEATS